MHVNQRGEWDHARGSAGNPLWSRRQALGILAAVLTAPGSSLLENALNPGAGGPDGRTELPPRTIGLRSLGGQFRFDPPGLEVRPGEGVTWLNMGDFHTVTAFHPDNAALFPGEIPLRIPEGAKSFHSGMLGLDAGSVFTYRFGQPGVYDYFCQPHYRFGMVGRVIAGDTAALGPPPPYRSELDDAARRQLPAVNEILGERGRRFEWASRINGVLLLRVNGVGDVQARARTLGEELRRPARRDLLPAEADAAGFRETLARFVAGAAHDDYERLVQDADRLKSALY